MQQKDLSRRTWARGIPQLFGLKVALGPVHLMVGCLYWSDCFSDPWDWAETPASPSRTGMGLIP